jgi:hypothetical protein
LEVLHLFDLSGWLSPLQIHNWASDLTKGLPSLEFVAPTKAYVVVNGTKVDLDMSKVPVRNGSEHSLHGLPY